MPHVVLIGDSIFDNAAYVAGGPDVVAQLSGVLPPGWQATLRAVDGAVVRDVERQLSRIPDDTSQLVVSAGGNDALGHIGILEQRAQSVPEVLDLLASIVSRFEASYRELLDSIRRVGVPTTVCTIYNGRMPDPAMQRQATTALSLFNDAILRAAFDFRFGVIELRSVCSEPEDYANPIEPSVKGGAKIARAIARAVEEGGEEPSRVFA